MNDVVKQNTKECHCCGSQEHLENRCKFIQSTCHYCRKEGHLQKMCQKKKREIKNVCQVDKVNGFKEEEYETGQSVLMRHVTTNEIIGSQEASNYSINVEG